MSLPTHISAKLESRRLRWLANWVFPLNPRRFKEALHCYVFTLFNSFASSLVIFFIAVGHQVVRPATRQMRVTFFLAGAAAPALVLGFRGESQNLSEVLMPPLKVETEVPVFLQNLGRLTPYGAAVRHGISRRGRVLGEIMGRMTGRREVPREPQRLGPLRKPVHVKAHAPLQARVFARPQAPPFKRPPIPPEMRGASRPVQRLPEKVPEQSPEARAAILQKLQREVVNVMQTNIQAKTHDKRVAGKRARHPVEDVAHDALIAMSGGSAVGDIILQNLSDPLTGRQVLAKCVVRDLTVLGVGGMGMVLAVGVVNEEAAAVLGAKELALKVMYYQFEGPNPPRPFVQQLAKGLNEMFEQELDPLRTVAKTTTFEGGEVTAKRIASDNKWALPMYQAVAGVSQIGNIYVHQNFGFFSKVILSQIMLGDGGDLIYQSPHGGRVSRLTPEGRQYYCSELITATAKLHEAKLCHWDIKPENTLIGHDGTVHLADFGMSGRTNEPRSCEEKLTPLFMDPEHASCALRHGFTSLNPQYDGWSVGLTCYIVMTNAALPYGIRPAKKLVEYLSSLSLVPHAASEQIKDPEKDLRDNGISPFWSTVVASLLARNRGDRPTLQELVAKYPKWPLGSN